MEKVDGSSPLGSTIFASRFPPEAALLLAVFYPRIHTSAMFDFITNLIRPKQKQPLPTLTDPFFGPMVYFPAARLWSGKTMFPSIDGDIEIEILIDGGETGPAESHRAFFQTVLARWPEVETSIGEILFPPIKKWAKRDYDENNPWAYFALRGIRLPSLETTPVEWAVSFWCPSVGHHFDVQMLDWKAGGLDISRK